MSRHGVPTETLTMMRALDVRVLGYLSISCQLGLVLTAGRSPDNP